MVRRDLRLWLGVAGFVVVVGGLALIAILRIPQYEIDGQWHLVLVETPFGSVRPASESWLLMERGSVRGVAECYEIMGGQYMVGDNGAFRMDSWGSETSCPSTDGIADAYSNHLSEITRYELSPSGLVLQTEDGSVQFTYELAGEAFRMPSPIMNLPGSITRA